MFVIQSHEFTFMETASICQTRFGFVVVEEDCGSIPRFQRILYLNTQTLRRLLMALCHINSAVNAEADVQVLLAELCLLFPCMN